MNTKNFSRGKLATRSGVNSETIRYYEKHGLIEAPPRSSGGHRLYDEYHLRQVIFIRRCRALGFSLSEIKSLARLDTSTQDGCTSTKQLLGEHLQQVREKRAELEKMEEALVAMIADCEQNQRAECPAMTTLTDLEI